MESVRKRMDSWTASYLYCTGPVRYTRRKNLLKFSKFKTLLFIAHAINDDDGKTVVKTVGSPLSMGRTMNRIRSVFGFNVQN